MLRGNSRFELFILYDWKTLQNSFDYIIANSKTKKFKKEDFSVYVAEGSKLSIIRGL